jgi:Ca2+-binding RTX toxin-like protein
MLTLAPPVSAGTIGIRDFTLMVGTEPGDGNQSISFSILGSDLVISGTTFDVVTAGCSGLGTVTCALADFNELIVLGGDGDDVINLSAISSPTFATLILGGPGNDVLIGSGGDDTIFGGAVDDVLEGGPGLDCLNPGSGNNISIQAATSSSCFDGPEPVHHAATQARGDARAQWSVAPGNRNRSTGVRPPPRSNSVGAVYDRTYKEPRFRSTLHGISEFLPNNFAAPSGLSGTFPDNLQFDSPAKAERPFCFEEVP